MHTLAAAKAAFTPVTKLDEGQKMKVLKIEKAFQSLVEDIFDLVPDDSADRTATIRKLIEAKFTITQAITHSATIKKNGKEKES